MLFKKNFWMLFAIHSVLQGAEQSVSQRPVDSPQGIVARFCIHWKDQIRRNNKRLRQEDTLVVRADKNNTCSLDVYTFPCDPGMPDEEGGVHRLSYESLAGYLYLKQGKEYVLIFPKIKTDGEELLKLLQQDLGSLLLTLVKSEISNVIFTGGEPLILGIEQRLGKKIESGRMITYQSLGYLNAQLKSGDVSYRGGREMATYHRPLKLSSVASTADAVVLSEPSLTGTLSRRFSELSSSCPPGSTPIPGVACLAVQEQRTKRNLQAVTEYEE